MFLAGMIVGAALVVAGVIFGTWLHAKTGWPRW